MVRQRLIKDTRWKISEPDIHHAQSHEILAVHLGPWLLASVYVPCTDTTGPQYQALADHLQGLRKSPHQPALVGGDFNYATKYPELCRSMEATANLLPLLQPPVITRLGNETGAPSLLDNIFYDRQSPLALDYVGHPEPRKGGRLDTYLKAHPTRLSDHLMVIAVIGQASVPDEPPPASQERPPRRISWRRLEQLIRESRVAATVHDEEPEQQARAAAEHQLKKIKQKLNEIGTHTTAYNLATLRDGIKAAMKEELGEWRPRLGPRDPTLRDPKVQEALRRRHKAWKALSRACQQGRSAANIAVKQKEHSKAARQWAPLHQAALHEAKQKALDSLLDHSGRPGVTTRRLFRLFSKARGRLSAKEATRLLDPEETAAFWQKQFTATAEDVRNWAPLCQDISITITTDQIKDAIKQMDRTAPGPDGIDFLVFQQFADDLAPMLAEAFTQTIREGLPDALREAETLLFPKGDPSANPSGYRPITLLDMIVRLFYKVLHIAFSTVVNSKKPKDGGLYPTQAGFIPERNGHEQVFLIQYLQAMEQSADRHKRFLAVLLLDITKAFDSLEYEVILDILKKRKYPLDWIEVMRQILPGNRTKILGRLVHLGRGSPQGGALSPDLCNIVMNELAQDLMDEIKGDQELGQHWHRWHRKTDARDHDWSLKLDSLMRLLLTLIQFADDITIVAGSPQVTERLLGITWRWAIRHRLVVSEKSLLFLLAAPHPSDMFKTFPHGPAPLEAGHLKLAWNHTQQFVVLGIRCQAAHYSLQRIQVHEVDEKKVMRLMRVVTGPFSMGKDRNYVSPEALRVGIQQLVYASMLYETAIQDIDYKKLQQVVVRQCRQVLHLQPTTPTAYVLWELRLWPAHLRAHKRALMFAMYILHHSWFGKMVLRPYLCEDLRKERRPDDIHPAFQVGPLGRLTRILTEYNLSWYHVLRKWDKPWKQRHNVSLEIQRTILLPRYVAYLKQRVTTAEDIPKTHRRQLLRDMALPALNACSEARVTPLYHCLSHALSVAGIVFRAPYLRYQNRGAQEARAPCVWCGEWEGECGYHLVRCTNAPPTITALRDRALRLIHTDVAGADAPQPDSCAHLEEDNVARLFSLYWRGRAKWGPKGRKDAGRQPDREALQASLLYMQEALNAYASQVSAVWALPTFINAPKPSAEEIASAMQTKAQYDLAASQDPFELTEDAFIDSLQRLGYVEDD